MGKEVDNNRKKGGGGERESGRENGVEKKEQDQHCFLSQNFLPYSMRKFIIK